MKTAIDWAEKPAPWCFIGPSFRLDVQRICEGRPVQTAPTKALDPAGLELMGRRVSLKLSQKQLAARAHCSQELISSLETGHSSASAETWDRIDAALEAAERAAA